jgi:hypothetical protein
VSRDNAASHVSQTEYKKDDMLPDIPSDTARHHFEMVSPPPPVQYTTSTKPAFAGSRTSSVSIGTKKARSPRS